MHRLASGLLHYCARTNVLYISVYCVRRINVVGFSGSGVELLTHVTCGATPKFVTRQESSAYHDCYLSLEGRNQALINVLLFLFQE